MPKDANRITVDLQLLRSRELEKLEAFGKQFEQAIDSLKASMGGYGAQLANAQNVTGSARRLTHGGSVSAGASVASPGVGGGAGHQGTSPGQTSPHASMPFWDRMTYGSYNLNPYEKGYFSVGNLANMGAVDLLRYASHLTGNVGYQEELGADGLPVNRSGFGTGVARGASRKLGLGARGLMYGQSANKVIQRLATSGRSMTSFGQGVGMSSQGSFGIPFTSPAARYTIERGFMAGKSSWFGLNPFYSSGQAKEAQGIASNYGFVGNDADTFSSRLKSLYEDRGMDQATSGGMLNQAFRQGGFTSVDALTNTLYNLRDAAAVAHMNTAQFTTDLQSLTQTLAQSGLAAAPVSSMAGQAYAAGTYLSPGAYAAAAQNQTLTFMQMGRTGQDYFEATHGPHQASQKLSTQLKVVEGMAGMPMSQWGAFRKRDPKGFDDMMSRLQLSMEKNPLTQGLNINDVIKMSTGRNGARGAISSSRFTEDMNIAEGYDHGGHLTQGFVNRLKQEAAASGVSSTDLSKLSGKSVHDQLKALEKLHQDARTFTDKQGLNLSIALAPGLDKYFKIIYDKAHTNTQVNYANPSSDLTGVRHKRS